MNKNKVSNFQKDVFNELINRYKFLIDEIEVEGEKIFVAKKEIAEKKLYVVAIAPTIKSMNLYNDVTEYFEKDGFEVTLNTIVLFKNSNDEGINMPENSIVVDVEKKEIVTYNEISRPVVSVLEDVLKRPVKEKKKLKTYIKEFNKNTPIATKCLIGLNVWIFIMTVAISFFMTEGGILWNILDVDSRILYIMGAKVNYLILEGQQWWRTIAHMFLHGGIIHLLFNMYALYLIGPGIERILGSIKFVLVYIFLGIGACIFSMLFTNGFSVGASGAIFGLLGINFTIAYLNKNNSFRNKEIFKNIAVLIFINLFIGFSSTGIDNAAHIGGLLFGIGVGYFIDLKMKRV